MTTNDAGAFGALGADGIRWLVATVFIFVGSGVFYLSSLVSGHNIYRDLQYQLALLATAVTGFLIFILSPLCFIVLFPKLYPASPQREILDAIPKDFKSARDNVDSVLGYLISNHVFLSYIFSAIGAGIVFGCSQLISPRRLALTRLRNILDIGFSIYSYQFTWDGFLHSIKRDGRMTITCGDDEITGNLWKFSVKNEPKEIMLRGATIRVSPLKGKDQLSDQDATSPHPAPVNNSFDKSNSRGHVSTVLITKSNDISRIFVTENAFKRNFDSSTATSYAFYLTVMLTGFAFLFISSELTANFTFIFGFPALADFYLLFGSLLLGVYCVVALILIPSILRDDFSNFFAALFLRPFFFYTFSLNCLAIVAGAWHHLQLYFRISTYSAGNAILNGLVAATLLIGVALFFWAQVVICRVNRELGCLIDEMIKIFPEKWSSNYESLVYLKSEFLDLIYQEQDLNLHSPGSFKSLINRLEKDDKALEDVCSVLTTAVARKEFVGMLGNDQFGIVNRLRFLVLRRIAREGRKVARERRS